MKNELYNDFISIFKNSGISVKFAKNLYKEILNEQAKTLSKCEEEISSISDVLQKHILKVLLFPKNNANEHWKNEIASYLTFINFLKSKNTKKKLSIDFIFSSLDIWEEEVVKMKCEILTYKYGKADVENIYGKFTSFLNLIFQNREMITIPMIDNILEKINSDKIE